ncbi:MAG: hypothetical protein QOJ07_3159 [Thermoleophilaceae bacterium]|nr:hypothetical protein [Thermoleophilaceae bacterium]
MPEHALHSGELFAALSLATDLGTGQPPEHGLATCLVSVRLGEAAGCGDEDLDAVFELALLHSLGCTSDATETAALYGDDRALRAAWTTVDESRPADVMRFLWRGTAPRGGAPVHALAFARAAAGGPAAARRGFTAHCEVGEGLAERLDAGERVRAGIWNVFERWDGKGYPRGVRGDALPPAARLLHVARDGLALARLAGDPAAAAEAIGARAGAAYEPRLAALAAADLPGWIAEAEAGSLWDAVRALRPGAGRPIAGAAFDGACRVVADFADLKSVHTLGHSRAVAEHAEAAAWRLGLEAGEVDVLRRAALLHDLGRVAVSNAIWDKPGPLGDSEWEQVRLHPHWTERVLVRCAALAPLAELAGADHERLDGSGYHRGRGAATLSPAARVLAVADAYAAMTEPRPHRAAIDPAAAARQLEEAARAGQLDADAVAALLAAAGHGPRRPVRPEAPAGLTGREIEVLRLVARGVPNKGVAAALGIAPKTVGHHVEHVYRKLGVSTRGAAALRAVELGIVRGGGP